MRIREAKCVTTSEQIFKLPSDGAEGIWDPSKVTFSVWCTAVLNLLSELESLYNVASAGFRVAMKDLFVKIMDALTVKVKPTDDVLKGYIENFVGFCDEVITKMKDLDVDVSEEDKAVHDGYVKKAAAYEAVLGPLAKMSSLLSSVNHLLSSADAELDDFAKKLVACDKMGSAIHQYLTAVVLPLAPSENSDEADSSQFSTVVAMEKALSDMKAAVEATDPTKMPKHVAALTLHESPLA